MLRSALLALLTLAVISGGSFAGGDLFDDDYSDCPIQTRLRDGQIADLAVARDADEGDEVNVSWAATDPALWGLGSNAYSTSLVVLLDDGNGDLMAKTLSLGTRKASFTGVETGTEVKVQLAIVTDAADGAYLVSDILEARVDQSIPAPSFTTRLWWFAAAFVVFDAGPVANSAFYYVGYNENFGNYKATGLITRPSTARLRIGLAHAGTGDKLDDSLEFDVYTDLNFDSYRVRITDAGGDVLPGGVDAATVASRSSYDKAFLRVGSIVQSQIPALVGNDRLLSNVRINDGGKISVAMWHLSSLPFTTGTVTPGNQGLSFAEVEPSIGNTVGALPPDEHRDFPIDMLTSDETFKFAAWAVNDKGESISPAASLTVRPIDTKANIGSVTNYANTGTPVTNAYVTERVFKKYKSTELSRAESMQHAVDHGEPDPGLGGFRQALVVLAQPPVPSQPGEGALHDPAPGQHLEAGCGGRAGHDRQDPVGGLLGQPGAQLGALVAAVSPDDPQAREAMPQPGQDPPRPVPVLEVGGVHDHGQEQAQGVDHEVALAPLDLLAGVVAPRPRHLRGLDRLAVEDGRAGAGLPPARGGAPGVAGPRGCVPRAPPAATSESSRRPSASRENRGAGCATNTLCAGHSGWHSQSPAGTRCGVGPGSWGPATRASAAATGPRSDHWGRVDVAWGTPVGYDRRSGGTSARETEESYSRPSFTGPIASFQNTL